MSGPRHDGAVLPGGVLGILGGGQLGAMFAQAARRMGYRVEAISDVADCPAARHCDRLHVGDYADTAFLTAAAANLDVVTFEFENVPAAAGAALAAVVPVRPHPDVLHTTQDRAREKAFLERHGFACAPYRVVRSREDYIARAVELAQSREALAPLRAQLRSTLRASGLMDAPAFAARFGELLESIHARALSERG